eukprot:12777-Heterococcus_DN1.PRE.1
MNLLLLEDLACNSDSSTSIVAAALQCTLYVHISCTNCCDSAYQSGCAMCSRCCVFASCMVQQRKAEVEYGDGRKGRCVFAKCKLDDSHILYCCDSCPVRAFIATAGLLRRVAYHARFVITHCSSRRADGMASSEHARLAAWVVGVVLPVVKAVSRVALVTAALLALAVVTTAYITASAAPSAAGTSATGGTAAASTTAAATAATAAATTAAAASTSTAAAGSNSGAAAAASTTSATAAASTTSAAAGSASTAVGAGKSSDKRKRTDELDSEHAGLTYA